MVMTTFEYYALLERIKKEEKNIDKKQKEKESSSSSSSSFYTSKEPGIIYDEWGNARLGIIEKTGFEGEGS